MASRRRRASVEGDTLRTQLIGDTLQVSIVRVSEVGRSSSLAGFVMDAIPDDTVCLASGDGSSYGEDELSVEGEFKELEDLFALWTIR